MLGRLFKINGATKSWKWSVNKVSSALCGNYSDIECNKSVHKSSSMVYNVIPQPRKAVTKAERKEYDALFPVIVHDLTTNCKDLPQVNDRFAKVLQFNVPNHKQASGITVVGAYKTLESAENATPNNIQLANILGWCVDLSLCSFQISDDVMDSSKFRRGLPCWYRHDGVGYRAINDAALIENSPYVLLKKYFSNHRCYYPCLEWFCEIAIKTFFGQSLDTMQRVDGKPDLETFTMNRWKTLAKYKSTYPQYIFPVKLAMHLANIHDTHLIEQVITILWELGEFITAQNDILDCYGDPAVTGKIGTDIQEGKGTWLIVTALKRATPAQRKVVEEHYGRSEPESATKIRVLYEELGLLNNFLKFEEESYISLLNQIEQLPEAVAKMLLDLVYTTYGGKRNYT